MQRALAASLVLKQTRWTRALWALSTRAKRRGTSHRKVGIISCTTWYEKQTREHWAGTYLGVILGKGHIVCLWKYFPWWKMNLRTIKMTSVCFQIIRICTCSLFWSLESHPRVCLGLSGLSVATQQCSFACAALTHLRRLYRLVGQLQLNRYGLTSKV